jgi:uncharacterized protein YbjT (DUF2867 family)
MNILDPSTTRPGAAGRGGHGRSVLVAGATGMLGSAVAAALHRTGARVTTFSRDPGRAEALSDVADAIVLGDATRPESLHGVFDGVDGVISCLGAPMAFTTGDRRSFRDLDTVANHNLIDAARAAGVRRFVYVSLLLRPAWSQTVYARAHEDVVDHLAASGLSYGIVRPTGMFPIFDPFLTMARRGVAWIPGDGRAQTNPVHPDEVAQTCLEALTHRHTSTTCLGGPEILTRQEIVELAFAAVGTRPRILHLPTGALAATSRLLRPLHPRLSEVTDFATRALTHTFVAPRTGERRLLDHFVEVAGAVDHPAAVPVVGTENR